MRTACNVRQLTCAPLLTKLTLELNIMLFFPISSCVCLVCQITSHETCTPAATKSAPALSGRTWLPFFSPGYTISVFWLFITHVRKHTFSFSIFHYVFLAFPQIIGFGWFLASQGVGGLRLHTSPTRTRTACLTVMITMSHIWLVGLVAGGESIGGRPGQTWILTWVRRGVRRKMKKKRRTMLCAAQSGGPIQMDA